MFYSFYDVAIEEKNYINDYDIEEMCTGDDGATYIKNFDGLWYEARNVEQHQGEYNFFFGCSD